MLKLQYPILLIKSTVKRSFSSLGRLIDKSGDTIARMLAASSDSFGNVQKIATTTFKDRKTVFLSIDDTLIKKFFSRFMEGSGYFFDSKLGRRIMAYKLMAGMITDGHYYFPFTGDFLFPAELAKDAKKRKLELFKAIVRLTQKLFSHKNIIVVADGAFATVAVLTWLIENNIKFEIRLARNRKITYNGTRLRVDEIKGFTPKGRQMARTVKAFWHNLDLFISAERRIDKYGNETIVYLASNYKTSPIMHVKNYKKRWPIEKFFRTSKQHLGLQECFSTKMETQKKHIASVFLAYSIVQLEMKKRRLKKPEEAIRALKMYKCNELSSLMAPLEDVFAMV